MFGELVFVFSTKFSFSVQRQKKVFLVDEAGGLKGSEDRVNQADDKRSISLIIKSQPGG